MDSVENKAKTSEKKVNRNIVIVLQVVVMLYAFHDSAYSEKPDSARLFHFDFYYFGDAGANLSGGIKTGPFYLGFTSADLTIHPWKNGNFFVSLANTHGNEPSVDFLGDYQYASNMEAGNHSFIYELWYRHKFGIGDVTIGLQEVNNDFAFTDYGASFVNSSFGIPPSMSCNTAAPTFPLTSPGITTRWYLSAKTQLNLAVFDGAPTDFHDNQLNLKWKLFKEDGIFFLSEIQRKVELGSLNGTVKGGFYFHEHFSSVDSTTRDNHGIYVIADQEIWKSASGSLGLFFQYGYCPEIDGNDHSYYLGGGIHYKGIFHKEGEDIAGFGLAHTRLTDARKETALELTYMFPVCSHFYLQPDVQYIINPAGTENDLDNCLVLFLRFGISL